MPIKRWITCTLLIVFLRTYKKKKNLLQPKFPLSMSLWMMFIGSVLLIVFDDRFPLIYRFLYPFLDAMDIYLPLFLGFFFFKERNLDIQIYKPLIYLSCIVCVYGIFNFITHYNPFVEWMIKVYSVDSRTFEILLREGWGGIRKGVMSLYRYTFDFGFNSGIFLLCLFYYGLTYRTKKIVYVCIVLSFLGVFLSASRTIILSVAFSTMLLFLLTKNSKKKSKILLFALLFVFLLYLFVPFVSSYINLILDTIIFQKGDLETGSSVSMREGQLVGALSLFSQNPILGNGFKYIFLDLDWKNFTYIDGMAGFESLVYMLLIERGVVGITVFFMFFLSIFVYYLKHIRTCRKYAALGLSIHVLFMLCAVGTGTLDSWQNSMLIQGMIIKSIELNGKCYISKSID